MIGSTIPLVTPFITQWEEARTTLANALRKYMESCISLEINSPEIAHPSNLVMRIDSELETLRSVLDQQIPQAQSILSKTRNKLASPMHRLPDEIIVEIFTHTIYSPLGPLPSCDLSLHDSVMFTSEMEANLLEIYRPLHTLLEVCSSWKEIIVAQQYFWSLIPTFPAKYDRRSLQLELTRSANIGLGRAQDCYLNIVVLPRRPCHLHSFLCEMPDPNMIFDALELHLSRVRTINIAASGQYYIRRMIDDIAQVPTRLSSLLQLSLCQDRDGRFYYKVPEEDDCIYSRESPGLVPFNQLLGSVSVLRLCGVHLRWDMLVFSNRLTKLQLRWINFGTDREMADNLYHALPSASGLRELEIVSATSLHDPETPHSFITPLSTISLPNLEFLVLNNLYFNTLHLLFGLIASRSHRLTLHLTWGSCHSFEPPRNRVTGYRALRAVLDQMPVHKLCINRILTSNTEELRSLLESLPMLDTLFLINIPLTAQYCDALTRRENGEDGSHTSSFPSFQHLGFSCVTIHDIPAFKRMVASHSRSMKKMILGGSISTGENMQPLDGRNSESKDIITQLREIVPDFTLIHNESVPFEFQPDWRPL